MAKCDIRPQLNDKIGFRTSKCKIRTEFESHIGLECQTRFSAQVRRSKKNFDCQNAIFGLNSNVRIGFRMSKCDNRPRDFEDQNF